MLATMGAKRRAARPSRQRVSSQRSRELRGFRSREPLMSRWPGPPPKIASNQLFHRLFGFSGLARYRQIAPQNRWLSRAPRERPGRREGRFAI
jgi:hypothetical protein